jgi:hypothetical protein
MSRPCKRSVLGVLKNISMGSYVQDGRDSPCRSVGANKGPPGTAPSGAYGSYSADSRAAVVSFRTIPVLLTQSRWVFE